MADFVKIDCRLMARYILRNAELREEIRNAKSSKERKQAREEESYNTGVLEALARLATGGSCETPEKFMMYETR